MLAHAFDQRNTVHGLNEGRCSSEPPRPYEKFGGQDSEVFFGLMRSLFWTYEKFGVEGYEKFGFCRCIDQLACQKLMRSPFGDFFGN